MKIVYSDSAVDDVIDTSAFTKNFTKFTKFSFNFFLDTWNIFCKKYVQIYKQCGAYY